MRWPRFWRWRRIVLTLDHTDRLSGVEFMRLWDAHDRLSLAVRVGERLAWFETRLHVLPPYKRKFAQLEARARRAEERSRLAAGVRYTSDD